MSARERDPLRRRGITHLGRIELEEFVGAGAMGYVYRGRHPRLGRRVAVKVMLDQGHERWRRRFQREVQALARLRHTNLLAIHEAGEEGGAPYLVSEWLEGQPLDEHLRGVGALDPDDAARLTLALARGLAHAHERGVLHRDLKPSNVVLVPERGPVLIDFGLAKQTELDQSRLTRTGTFAGTAGYAAPEQLLDASRVDERADVYGLAATLFTLLTNRSPASDTTDVMSLVARAAADRLPRARELRPEVPAALDAIVARAMAGDPAERTPSAAALADELERFLAADPQASRSLPPRRVLLLGLGLSALLAAAGLAGLAASAPGEGPDAAPSLASAPPATPSSARPEASPQPAPPATARLRLPPDPPLPVGSPTWRRELAAAQREVAECMRRGHAGPPNDELRGRLGEELRARLGRVDRAADGLAPTDLERNLLGALAFVDQGRWASAGLRLSALRSYDLRPELAYAAGEIARAEVSAEQAASLLKEAAEREVQSEAERPAQALARAWRRSLLRGELAPADRQQLHAWCAAPERWLRRHAWLALACLAGYGQEAFGADPVAGLAELERACPAPCDSLAFHLLLVRHPRAWPDHLLDRLELTVRANDREPTRALRGLARLAAEVGRLGTLRRLEGLGRKIDFEGARERARRVVEEATSVAPRSWVILDPGGTTLVLSRPVSHLCWSFPAGDWAIRLRGSEVDLDLLVRRDGPPALGHPETRSALTLAADEVLPLPPGSGGLHQVVIRRARSWPHPVGVRLDLVPAQSRFSSPWGVVPAYERDDPRLLAIRAGALDPQRVGDALRALEAVEAEQPEAILERARALEAAGRWRELRALPGRAAGLRPAVQRALRYSAARAAAELGEHAEAERLLRGLLREEPTLAAASEELALALIAQRRPQEAVDGLRALARDPTQRAAEWLLRAIEAAAEGTPPSLDEEAKRELARRPRLRLLLGRAWIDLGRPRWWLDPLDDRPPGPAEQLLRAEAHLAAGRLEAAKRTLRALDFSQLPPFRVARLRQLEADLARREAARAR